MKFILNSFADGLTSLTYPLEATTKKAMRQEVRKLFPSAEKILFNNEKVCVIGHAEVLRYFVERRTPKGKLRRF